jgi:NAD-dependent dihydropyrimidine dehydrogenase PreA subunit
MGFLGGNQASPAQTARYLDPAPGNVHNNPQSPGAPPSNGMTNGATNGASHEPFDLSGGTAPQGETSETSETSAASNGEPIRILEETGRRWYPVIDFSRCTNCMECLDFCLFGVYGVDRFETILVEQPDNCRKGCPACSRVCPANAIIFPQHKTPAIAGSPEAGGAAAFKIDLSKLFGAPEGIDAAVEERDAELVAAGRDAVGMSVGIPKRQDGKPDAPKDKLDSLMDQLDDLDL